jgi:hypothetical protein
MTTTMQLDGQRSAPPTMFSGIRFKRFIEVS